MSNFQEYYEKQLYPLQDKVLRIIEGCKTNFYLTGGTALSRGYFKHRYSDDLDFFVNRRSDFEDQTQLIFDTLKANFTDVRVTLSYDSFARCFVTENEIELKVEFVNDVLFRVDQPIQTDLFLQTDNLDNILSNKICALSRNHPKDLADIWFIAKNKNFVWKEVIENAKNKDLWVDETQIFIILEGFDILRLNEINWIQPFNEEFAKQQWKILLQDVLFGTQNRLVNQPQT